MQKALKSYKWRGGRAPIRVITTGYDKVTNSKTTNDLCGGTAHTYFLNESSHSRKKDKYYWEIILSLFDGCFSYVGHVSSPMVHFLAKDLTIRWVSSNTPDSISATQKTHSYTQIHIICVLSQQYQKYYEKSQNDKSYLEMSSIISVSRCVLYKSRQYFCMQTSCYVDPQRPWFVQSSEKKKKKLQNISQGSATRQTAFLSNIDMTMRFFYVTATKD